MVNRDGKKQAALQNNLVRFCHALASGGLEGSHIGREPREQQEKEGFRKQVSVQWTQRGLMHSGNHAPKCPMSDCEPDFFAGWQTLFCPTTRAAGDVSTFPSRSVGGLEAPGGEPCVLSSRILRPP